MSLQFKRSHTAHSEVLEQWNGGRTTRWADPPAGTSVMEIQTTHNPSQFKDVPIDKNYLIPPYHWHWYQDETFDIIKGQVEDAVRFIFNLEGVETVHDASSGQITIPAKARHTFRVDPNSPEPCTIHILLLTDRGGDEELHSKLEIEYVPPHKPSLYVDFRIPIQSTFPYIVESNHKKTRAIYVKSKTPVHSRFFQCLLFDPNWLKLPLRRLFSVKAEMRIACLQFAPNVGDVENNINQADTILGKADPKNLDWLVLPEMAFSGYNFKSLLQITPYLEPTASGVTSLWAKSTARKYSCYVTVGYPEKATNTSDSASLASYNSTVTVSPIGEIVANYRKTFLYYTDDSWATEGTGFYSGEIPTIGKVAMGICMDLNSYKFEAPWTAYEFATHIVQEQANVAVISMAWNTREEAISFHKSPEEPCMDTLSYWLARLKPLLAADKPKEVIVVMANRTGVEDDAVFVGTSAIIGIDCGQVKLYGVLGRGEKKLLEIDTSKPRGKLIFA